MNPQSQFSRLKALGKRSFSDFVKTDTGRVGSKNALALGSLVGGSVLMELFLSGIAHATCCAHSQNLVGSLCYNTCYECSTPGYHHVLCPGSGPSCPGQWTSDPANCN